MTYNDLISTAPTETIASAFVKAYQIIQNCGYDKILVSVSGGSDSDILMDFVEKIGYKCGTVDYVFFDTGMEFEATKQHLKYLENKYGVTIHKEKAVVPVPLGCKKYGVPFLSKQVSEFISRLQRHKFTWNDEPFDVLYEKFPKCKSALKWWCNEWGEKSRINISNWKYLKEFLIACPPDFPISCGCCNGAKKRTAHAIAKKHSPDLDIQGVRKGEGGARSVAYTSCYDRVFGGCDRLRPIFWFKQADKIAYKSCYGIVNSDCYKEYGLTRTGCACCPFGSNFEFELEVAKNYEPKLYKAAVSVFGKSYEYTRKYRQFKQEATSEHDCNG